MKKLLQILAVVTPAALGFVASATVMSTATPALAADKGQDQVKKGLRIINQVVGHTGRLVAGKEYAHVAHEHEEVLEAKQILDESLTVDQKTKVDATLVKAVAASTTLKDTAATKDAAKIEAAHAAFAASVQDLLALFPADYQPPPPKK